MLQRRQQSQVFSVIICVNIVAIGKYSPAGKIKRADGG